MARASQRKDHTDHLEIEEEDSAPAALRLSPKTTLSLSISSAWITIIAATQTAVKPISTQPTAVITTYPPGTYPAMGLKLWFSLSKDTNGIDQAGEPSLKPQGTPVPPLPSGATCRRLTAAPP
jgi:hypothetical protein